MGTACPFADTDSGTGKGTGGIEFSDPGFVPVIPVIAIANHYGTLVVLSPETAPTLILQLSAGSDPEEIAFDIGSNGNNKTIGADTNDNPSS